MFSIFEGSSSPFTKRLASREVACEKEKDKKNTIVLQKYDNGQMNC